MFICSDCPNAVHWSAPGVGFDLTLDYGVSAVHFSNGTTTVPISAIEGNAAYKNQMRELVTTAAAYNWTAGIEEPVPTWLQYAKGLFLPRAPPSPLQGMLGLLKANTEAYLGHEVHHVSVSLPALLAPDSYQVHAVNSALKELGITQAADRCFQALRAASEGYGMDHSPYILPPQWVLGLDYSRSALIIAVDEHDRGVFEYFTWKIRTDLGYDSAWIPSTNPYSKSLIAKPHYWEEVEEELRQALEVIGNGRIGRLILAGDRIAADDQLLKVVSKVLGTETYDNAIRSNTALRERGVIVDPVFAAAMGEAQMADGRRLNGPDGCYYAGNCPGAELYHSAPKEMADIARGICDLTLVLRELRWVLREGQAIYRDRLLRAIQSAVRRIRKIHKDINGLIAGDDGPSPVVRILWVFRKSKAAVLLARIESHKSTVQLMVTTMLLAVEHHRQQTPAASGQDTDDDNEDRILSIRLDAENLVRIAGQSLQGMLSGSDNSTCDQGTQTTYTSSVVSINDDEPCDVPDPQIDGVGGQVQKWDAVSNDTAAWMYKLVFSGNEVAKNLVQNRQQDSYQLSAINVDSGASQAEGCMPSSQGVLITTSSDAHQVIDRLLRRWTTLAAKESSTIDTEDDENFPKAGSAFEIPDRPKLPVDTPQGNPTHKEQWEWLPPYSERPRGKFAVLGESLEYQSCVNWNGRAYLR
ncbi:hypothetical protein O988_06617 [Pseudogymnoascus sp. VKM F-3808]|nr:hypothetical protein O988_06617 [Pseudogymnoascus sp. VKM F-3808]